MTYDKHVPGIYQWKLEISLKVASFVLVSCHMSQIGLLHAWSDASCQLQDSSSSCSDGLQALNLNCIYESNILVLI